MPRALIIVVTYNQAPHLRRALRGYLRQTTRNFHLTVADDGSREDTRELLETMAPEFAAQSVGFQHVWHEDRGFRKCTILNEAVRRSPAADLLIFTDGDCLPPARFVERHLNAHEPMSLHVAGAFRLTREQSEAVDADAVARGTYEGIGSAENRRKLGKKRRQSIWGTRLGRRNRPKILGLNMAFDRQLFEALNGFDEEFVDWGVGEDSDMRDRAMRLRPKPRVKVLYTANDVYHLWHPISKDLSRSRARRKLDRPVRCVRGLDSA
jgi:glycosyltransferase involved in cell wall biosynthesis